MIDIAPYCQVTHYGNAFYPLNFNVSNFPGKFKEITNDKRTKPVQPQLAAVGNHLMTNVFHKQLFVQTITFALTIFLFGQLCFGQSDITIPDTKGDKESFMQLKDGALKREIAFFNITGSFQTKTDSFPKTKVNEIPPLNCTDSSATFSGNGLTISISAIKFDTTGHKLTYVDSRNSFLILIDDKPFWGTDGGIPKEKIKSVIFQNGKQKLVFPDSAIAGLCEPNFCFIDKSSGQTTNLHCKAFQSVDKKRVYIYMLNSDGAGGYELTWIIQDNKYFGRIVDYGF